MPRRRHDPDLAVLVGARLRGVREAAGLSQQALADRVRAAAPTISRIESGDLTPTLSTLNALAIALGVRLSALLDLGATIDVAPASGEETLLGQFRRLPPGQQAAVRGLVGALLNAARPD